MHGRTALLAAAIAATTFVSVPTAVARTLISVGDGQGRLAYKPRALPSGGSGVGGGVWSARRLHWTAYGRLRARANGILRFNTCDPMCASGNLRSVHARFRFHRVRRHCEIQRYPGEPYVTARRIFTRVDIHVPSFPRGSRTWRTAPADGFACDPPSG